MTSPMPQFVNIAAYQFAPLQDVKALRAELQERCKAWGTKGSILLSTEGINLFVAGGAPEIEQLLQRLRSIEGLANLTVKVSQSDTQPFRRMLVRIKKEIIAFGVEGIDPARETAPKISPEELKRWLDEKREFTLLDTRNDFEIALGTFERAVPIGVKHFREFPQATQSLPPSGKEKPIVLFCTGGIRCEKAGAYMRREGFSNVLQLDGGILNYFEKVGSQHYQGECFVFDQRVCLDPQLQQTASAQCYACLTPLTALEQKDQRYEEGRSCPYCFRTSEEKMRETIAERHRALAELTEPLPGSAPYVQERPVKVPEKNEGEELLDFLCGTFRHLSREYWQEEINEQRVCDARRGTVTAGRKVRAGERFYCLSPNHSEPPVSTDVRILHEDEAIIVLEKPAPLPVHACGRFSKNTLQFFLEKLYSPQKPHIAHRLDTDTSGIMVVARTKHFASLVQPQFARGEVHKTYLARVNGHPPSDDFVCDLAVSDGLSNAGTREADSDGLESRTEFTVVQRFGDGTALVEARPVTGRTNQIRIHLWELGFPICGDPMYLPNRGLEKTQSKASVERPLCLHSKSIEFSHPLSQTRMKFETGEVPWSR